MTNTPQGWGEDGYRPMPTSKDLPSNQAAAPQGTPPPSPPEVIARSPHSRRWILPTTLGAAVVVVALVGEYVMSALADAETARAEAAADAVVEVYIQAWQESDCDKFRSTASTRLRFEYGFADCAEFVAAAGAWRDSLANYEVRFTGTGRTAGTMYVMTQETYSGGSDYHAYKMIEKGDAWFVDDEPPDLRR